MSTSSLAVHRTAATLYPDLIERAGLTGKKNDRAGRYDRELLDELRTILFGENCAEEPLERLIGTRAVSADELIQAFFTAVAPFAEMKKDILAMLADAGAHGSGDALAIQFNFDNPAAVPLRLDQFRSQMELVSERLIERPTFPLTPDLLWRMIGIRIDRWGATRYEAVDRWIERYDDGSGRKEPVPSEILADNGERFPHLKRALTVINRVIAHLATTAAGEPIADAAGASAEATPIEVGWYNIRHDHWPRAAVLWLEERIFEAGYLSDSVGDRVREELDALIPPDAPLEQVLETHRRLEDILDLPVWKLRSEVYAVWLGSQIYQAATARGWQVRFHLVDGRLDFAFRGVHLATLIHPRAPDVLFWWTELTSPAPTIVSRFRKQAIKPDYRIQKAPLSEGQNDVLILEAKQHLASKKGEFSSALNDYAKTCPMAQVILANYGPVAASVSAAVDPAVRGRTLARAGVRPLNDDARTALHAAIGAAIGGDPLPGALTEPAPDASPAPFADPVRIVLSWPEPGMDLDLHLIRMRDGQHICWVKLEGDDVALAGDVRSGQSFETATIRPCADQYVIAVYRFTEGASGFSSQAHVRILCGDDTAPALVELDAAAAAPERCWHVATIDMATQQISIIDAYLSSLPKLAA